MRTINIFILLLLLSFSVTGEIYRVYTDREFGFWAVRAENTSNNSHFVNKTLSINTGDTIQFVNMDGNDDRINIISDNRLWEGGATLSGTGKKFDFTFNSSGYFRFHIIERTHTELNASNFTDNRTDSTLTSRTCETDEDGNIVYDDSGNEKCTTRITAYNTRQYEVEYLKRVTDISSFQYQALLVKVSGKQVGNGTFPVPSNVTKTVTQSGYNSGYTGTSGRQTISVNASPKPKATPATMIDKIQSAPPILESYQEFTLYETFKRWFMILKGN